MISSFTRLRILIIFGTLLTATILATVGLGGSTGGPQQKTTKVAGTVFAWTGAVIGNAIVSVKGSSFNRESLTNEEGQYHIDVPTGIYSLEVRSSGFCLARRASFNARSQVQLEFDFTLLVCPSHGQGPMSYESFTLNSGASIPVAFLIHYGKRADQEETIEFDGANTQLDYYDPDAKVTVRRQVYVNLTVTYDRWTISASHLTLNKRTLRLSLSGDVVILDGGKEIKGKRAEVDFAVPRPVLNMTE